jgi:hypothetical protein
VLPPPYDSKNAYSNPAATYLGGQPVSGVCVLSLYYTSQCGPQNMSGWAPGWQHAASDPSGCDFNSCAGSSCQENFCIDCASVGGCASCPS